MKFLISCLCLLGGLTLSAQEPQRTWTNLDGRTLEAKMLSSDGVHVSVMTPDAEVFSLNLATLSEGDQGYVRERQTVRNPVSGGGRGAAAAQGRRAKWLADGDAAAREAREQNLPILLLFTGSDWCPPCMRLESTVFENKTFQEFADKHLVLQIADFPRRKSIPRKQQDANQALAQKHGIRGYPTLVLLDSSGKAVDRFGYGGQDAKAFTRMLESKLKK